MSIPELTASRTVAANQARQQSTRDKLERIETTLRTMRRERTPVTYPAVARRAGVSRTFLYQNTDAKNLMTAAIAASGDQRRRAQTAHDAQAEASWHQRALNAEDALKTTYAEIDNQRERIGILLGQLRDLQAQYTEGTAERLAEENTALKQRIRQLTNDNRGLEQKLQAARSNNRFLDKRLADLEAELLDTELSHPTSARTRS
jgi:chromosome segregation ATPase